MRKNRPTLAKPPQTMRKPSPMKLKITLSVWPKKTHAIRVRCAAVSAIDAMASMLTPSAIPRETIWLCR